MQGRGLDVCSPKGMPKIVERKVDSVPEKQQCVTPGGDGAAQHRHPW
jgi:hypothetical protein